MAAAKVGPHRAIRAEPVTGGTIREAIVIEAAIVDKAVIQTTVPVVPHEGNITGRVYRIASSSSDSYARQYDLTVGLNGNIASNALEATRDRCLDNPKDTKSGFDQTADLIAHRGKLRRLRTIRSSRSLHQHDLPVLLQHNSAAGVAVTEQASGVYTFMAHLKWGWAIALGYAASVLAHLLINARFFVTGG